MIAHSVKKYTCQGLSLIELMVALLIGVVLTFGAVNLFLQSKLSYFQDEEGARLQENGRYASRYISRELSMAGFIGGVLGGDVISAFPTGGDACFNFLNGDSADAFPFEHYNDVSSTSALDPNIPSACWSSSDVLYKDPDPAVPAPDVLVVRRTKDRLTDPNDPGVSLDSSKFYLRILDANVSVTVAQGGSATSNVDWWEYYPQIIFIRDHSIAATDGIPTLCRKRLATGGAKAASDTECLIEGVENLQIEWGVDSDGDQQADYFVADPTDDELSGAVAARVYLLIRSVNEVSGYTNEKNYILGQTAVNPPEDGFFRRVFQTTVLLRNSEAYKF